MLGHLGPRNNGFGQFSAVKIGDRRQFREVEIAALILRQQHERRRTGPALGRAAANPDDGDGAANDRLNARILGVGRVLKSAEQVGAVGKAGGRHLGLGGQLADLVGLDSAFQQRIGRTDPQVDEALPLRVRHDRPPLDHRRLATQATRLATVHIIQTKPITETRAKDSRATRIIGTSTDFLFCSIFRFCSVHKMFHCNLVHFLCAERWSVPRKPRNEWPSRRESARSTPCA